jgi:hypothetical protein
MRRLLFGGVAAALMFPGFLGAQEDPRLVSRVDRATRMEVSSIIRSARELGLPTEPLVDKVLEGTSRHASRERIVIAVTRLYEGMRTVQRLLGTDARPEELSAGALAIRAGADEQSVVALRLARPVGDLTTPLGVLADLVAIGVTPNAASIIVARLTGKGATDGELLELYGAVVNDIRAGYPPVTAASVRSGIPTAAPPPMAPVVAEGVARPPQP